MNRRTEAITLCVVVLLVASIPATVLAQAVPQNVLFDEETENVATVTIDGQPYEVYRIDNVAWYASGIDIYADGERVRSESTARAVLSKLARRRAASEIGPDDLRTLRTATRDVSAAKPSVSAAAQDIDDTLGRLTELQSMHADGSNAYNASVEAAPKIEEFNETARERLPGLRSFENNSAAFVENATTLIELVERRENGSTVDPQRIYNTYVATIQANDALSEHYGFGSVPETLSDLAMASETIASNVTSVPETGNQTAEHFERVSDSASTAANATAAIELPEFEFEDAQDSAQSMESRWMDQWHARQNAGKDIGNTIFGLLVAFGCIAGYVGWRRR